MTRLIDDIRRLGRLKRRQFVPPDFEAQWAKHTAQVIELLKHPIRWIRVSWSVRRINTIIQSLESALLWRPHQSVDTSSVLPGSSTGLRVGHKVIAHTAGEIEAAGKRYHLEPGYSLEVTLDGLLVFRDLQGNVIQPSVSSYSSEKPRSSQ